MGLGIHVGAEIPRKGILKRILPNQDIFDLIEYLAISFLKKNTLDHACSTRNEEVLYLSFHPSEEDVYFYATDDNDIVCSAKTSSAGPGYHALLIELLDYIDQNSDISWIWESEESEYQDETGYYFHRDFQKLQIAMAEQLHAIATHVIADQELSQLRYHYHLILLSIIRDLLPLLWDSGTETFLRKFQGNNKVIQICLNWLSNFIHGGIEILMVSSGRTLFSPRCGPIFPGILR